MRPALFVLGLAAAAAALPVVAQGKPAPGAAADGAAAKTASLVEAGTYAADPNHTQVIWKVDHLGVTPLYGAFGGAEGTLTIDPAKLSAAKVSLTFPMTGMTVTSPDFLKHLSSADFFEVAKFPNATFVSTAVVPTGMTARITGNLTVHGVTKPVVLDARFHGAGPNPMNKKLNIGFTATAKVKRSDFGLGMAVPIVSDEVDLKIVGAFEKK